jgi:hypothetical protein
MRRTFLLITALALFGCSHPNAMNSSEIPARSRADAPQVAEASHAPDAAQLPGLDRAAADIISSGKYETATFALG